MNMNKQRIAVFSTMLKLLAVLSPCITFAAGSCSFPTDLQTGTWISSDQSSLTFNSTTMSGYTVSGKGIIAFTCELKSGDYYVVKSDEFPLYSSTGIGIMCMTFTKIKTSLYSYTIYTAKLQDLDNQRMRFLSSSTTITDILACTDSINTEYSLLMAEGQIDSLKIECPDVILGKFSYSFNGTDCVNMTGSLDVCTDPYKLDFNYTACTTQQAYSADGEMNCIYSTTSGTATTVSVYNLDTTTDESSTYRFTCYIFESSGGFVYGTQYPKDCHTTQNSTYVEDPGATLTLLAADTCVPETSTSSTVAVSSASLVSGVIAGLFILLLIVALLIGYCCYMKKKKVEPTGRPPLDTGLYIRSTAKVIYGREKLRKKEKPVMPAKSKAVIEDYNLEDHEDEDGSDFGLESVSEVPPLSTTMEVGSCMKRNGRPNGHLPGLERQEISIHFKDMKELELTRQRNQAVEECPITACSSKDPYWTPTYDGSVRPRMELSYVQPKEYNGVLRELHPIPPQRRPLTPPRRTQGMTPAFEPSPPPSPNIEHKKKKKRRKKKKHVHIIEDESY